MKNNTFTILKKELARLFGDPKLVFSGIILQGLLLYVMYTLLGTFMSNMLNVEEDYQFQVSVVNMPASVTGMLEASGLPVEITHISQADMAAVKELVASKDVDLLVEFPTNFDEAVLNFDVGITPENVPQVQMWSNMGQMESIQINSIIQGMLFDFERSMTKRFDINMLLDPDEYDLNPGASLDMTFTMSMIPMLILMLIYTGCMAIAPESIAGEKERGTLGTMLVTPTRRRDMALAKILSISIFGFLGATTSFIAMALSMPKMMGGVGDIEFDFSAIDFLMTFAILVSTVLVFVALLSVMSAYAKSIKEANSYAAPFMMVSVFCGMSSMFTGGALSGAQFYLIPIFNSAQSLSAILNSDASNLNSMVTIFTNVAFALICAGVLARMFSSEKIVFDK